MKKKRKRATKPKEQDMYWTRPMNEREVAAQEGLVPGTGQCMHPAATRAEIEGELTRAELLARGRCPERVAGVFVNGPPSILQAWLDEAARIKRDHLRTDPLGSPQVHPYTLPPGLHMFFLCSAHAADWAASLDEDCILKYESNWNTEMLVAVANADHPNFVVIAKMSPAHRLEWDGRECPGSVGFECHAQPVATWLFTGAGHPNLTRLLQTLHAGHLPEQIDEYCQMEPQCRRCIDAFLTQMGQATPEWL